MINEIMLSHSLRVYSLQYRVYSCAPGSEDHYSDLLTWNMVSFAFKTFTLIVIRDNFPVFKEFLI